MEEAVRQAVDFVIPLVEAVGASVIVAGVFVTFAFWVGSELRLKSSSYEELGSGSRGSSPSASSSSSARTSSARRCRRASRRSGGSGRSRRSARCSTTSSREI